MPKEVIHYKGGLVIHPSPRGKTIKVLARWHAACGNFYGENSQIREEVTCRKCKRLMLRSRYAPDGFVRLSDAPHCTLDLSIEQMMWGGKPLGTTSHWPLPLATSKRLASKDWKWLLPFTTK